jgi:hypothetical protein
MGILDGVSVWSLAEGDSIGRVDSWVIHVGQWKVEVKWRSSGGAN